MELDKLIHFTLAPEVNLDNTPIKPAVSETEIATFWEGYQRINPESFNGKILYSSHKEIDISGDKAIITLHEGDYAYCMYLMAHQMVNLHLTVAPVTIPITSDGFSVYGRQAKHTAHGEKILALGGGLIKADIQGNSLEAGVWRELSEESGLQHPQHTINQGLIGAYIYSQIPTLLIVHYCMLNLKKDQVAVLFESHNGALRTAGKLPEIEDLLFIHRNNLKTFFEDPNVSPYIPPAAKELHYRKMK